MGENMSIRKVLSWVMARTLGELQTYRHRDRARDLIDALYTQGHPFYGAELVEHEFVNYRVGNQLVGTWKVTIQHVNPVRTADIIPFNKSK